MGYIQVSLPEHFYCLVRKEFITNGKETGYIKAICFGARSVASRSLGFWVLLENGAQYGPLPIHALSWKECDKQPLDHLELWDCFGENVSAHLFEFLREISGWTKLKDDKWYSFSYICTFDWVGNGFSSEPTQIKTAHLLKLDDGNFALQPNNRCMWHDPSFTDTKLDAKLSLHVQTEAFSSESNNWLVKDDSWNYDLTENKPR